MKRHDVLKFTFLALFYNTIMNKADMFCGSECSIFFVSKHKHFLASFSNWLLPICLGGCLATRALEGGNVCIAQQIPMIEF